MLNPLTVGTNRPLQRPPELSAVPIATLLSLGLAISHVMFSPICTHHNASTIPAKSVAVSSPEMMSCCATFVPPTKPLSLGRDLRRGRAFAVSRRS